MTNFFLLLTYNMVNMNNFFPYIRYRMTRHLNEAQQSYFEHLSDAWSYAARSGLASLSFFVHGILPFTLEHTGSAQLNSVYSEVSTKLEKTNKTQQQPQQQQHSSIVDESS